ncbi:hypothetical protein JGH11_13300 [Dysgonomonas sp. Marseille-P4677]|uniref:hypothetical protein n=1 Tax=Dysgonomonas sp. Marseille-P4677 TaxID=2364790 RepID=UPI0019143A5E|nr:hypothetical protein [Dysgonomonas sp. Marseille-P4677]MBK5721850.1 hypothetical protein [Dysgonomonas sp. Marseille-P4677]
MKQVRYQRLFVAILFLFTLSTASAQKDKDKDEDRVYWNERQQLEVADFGIHTQNMESGATSAEFAIDYQVSKFNFVTKNFNKNVRNYMVKSTSQIDTTGNVQQYLLYQQTLFDLSEVYARELRKALRENRKLLIRSTSVADELNWKVMSEFMSRRVRYTQETNSAGDTGKQKEWERQIAYELNELKDFAYDSK